MKKNALGHHVLTELYGCPMEVLDNLQFITDEMTIAAIETGADILKTAFHKFSPQGVTGFVMISESHLAIHTWPEYGYAALDVFTCGCKVNPWIASRHLEKRLGAQTVRFKEVFRGILDNAPHHKPPHAEQAGVQHVFL